MSSAVSFLTVRRSDLLFLYRSDLPETAQSPLFETRTLVLTEFFPLISVSFGFAYLHPIVISNENINTDGLARQRGNLQKKQQQYELIHPTHLQAKLTKTYKNRLQQLLCVTCIFRCTLDTYREIYMSFSKYSRHLAAFMCRIASNPCKYFVTENVHDRTSCSWFLLLLNFVHIILSD